MAAEGVNITAILRERLGRNWNDLEEPQYRNSGEEM
jgi:hypothetical protein